MRAKPLQYPKPSATHRLNWVICGLMLLLVLLLVFSGCGHALVRAGADTPTLYATDAGWKAVGNGVEATGSSWEEASQNWRKKNHE